MCMAHRGDTDVDVVGGTFVGGSSSGWEIVDPNANAAALGLVTQPVFGGGAAYTPPATTPIMTFGAPATTTAAPYNPYASTGFVGGSWSPEPLGNNQILYGHYSASGALALPQAQWGQTATTPAATTPAATPAATTTAPATTTPATTGGGTTPAKPADPAKAETRTAAEKKAAADKPEPKKVTVKSGDTLSAIARANGTTVAKLYAANKAVIGGNPNLIKPGQVLKIPA